MQLQIEHVSTCCFGLNQCKVKSFLALCSVFNFALCTFNKWISGCSDACNIPKDVLGGHVRTYLFFPHENLYNICPQNVGRYLPDGTHLASEDSAHSV
jgi:hypothetical protein